MGLVRFFKKLFSPFFLSKKISKNEVKKFMKSKTFYTILGFVVGLILSWDLLWMRSIDMAKAGVSLWIGFAVVLLVLLLEIVPTVIMLTTYLDHKKMATSNAVISWKPVKDKMIFSIIGVALGLILGVNVVWARSIDLSQAGVAFWIFLGLGLFIVLLQLIPAIIMFIIFVGTATKIVHDKVPVKDEAKEDKAKEEAKP